MGAGDGHGAVKGGEAITDTAQAGSALGVGPTGTVINHDQLETIMLVGQLEAGVLGVGVAADVGQCLSGGEVHRGLDRGLEPSG